MEFRLDIDLVATENFHRQVDGPPIAMHLTYLAAPIAANCSLHAALPSMRGPDSIYLDTYMLWEYTKEMESVFGIIAEPNRRAILSLLVSSQRSVGEIERRLRMTQPAVSKHCECCATLVSWNPPWTHSAVSTG